MESTVSVFPIHPFSIDRACQVRMEGEIECLASVFPLHNLHGIPVDHDGGGGITSAQNRRQDCKEKEGFLHGSFRENGLPQLFQGFIGPFAVLAGGDVGDATVFQHKEDVICAGDIEVGGVVD